MSYQVREATIDDMKAVHNLIVELAVFEKEQDAVEVSVSDLERDGFSSTPKFKVFVAEEGTTIIGMALIYERYSTWKGKAIHLEDLIVTQTKRGLGVGKALYTKVLDYAHKLGVKRVAWEVLDWNTNAIDFYENSGANILKDWLVVHMTKNNLDNYINENI